MGYPRAKQLLAQAAKEAEKDKKLQQLYKKYSSRVGSGLRGDDSASDAQSSLAAAAKARRANFRRQQRVHALPTSAKRNQTRFDQATSAARAARASRKQARGLQL